MARVSALKEVTPFATVEEAIEDIRQGRFVVVVDAADRENEGDLTIAAQFATPEAINFMATHGRGLICLCLTEERCDELGLRPMTERNETPYGTASKLSVLRSPSTTVRHTPSIATESPIAADSADSTRRRPSSNETTRPTSLTRPVNTLEG